VLAERHRELLRRRDTDMQQQLEAPPAPERDPPPPPAHHTSMHHNTLAAEREGEVRWRQSGGVWGGSRSGEAKGGGGGGGQSAGGGSRVGAWWDGGIGGDIGGTPMVRHAGKRRRGVRAGDEDEDIAGETHGCVMREGHAEAAVVAGEGQARQLKAPQLPHLPASAHTLPGEFSSVLPLASIPKTGRELARMSGERDREEGAGEGRADGVQAGILLPKVRYFSTSKPYGGYTVLPL
jgi:hypothetical protein